MTWSVIVTIIGSAPIGVLLGWLVKRKQDNAIAGKTIVDGAAVLTESSIVMLKPLNDEIERLRQKVATLIETIDRKDAEIDHLRNLLHDTR